MGCAERSMAVDAVGVLIRMLVRVLVRIRTGMHGVLRRRIQQGGGCRDTWSRWGPRPTSRASRSGVVRQADSDPFCEHNMWMRQAQRMRSPVGLSGGPALPGGPEGAAALHKQDEPDHDNHQPGAD